MEGKTTSEGKPIQKRTRGKTAESSPGWRLDAEGAKRQINGTIGLCILQIIAEALLEPEVTTDCA